jgi:hypothetical protein
MDPMSLFILGSLSLVFLGLPTLLVVMAWTTRDRPVSRAAPIVTAPRKGHAARVREARRLAEAAAVVTVPALP